MTGGHTWPERLNVRMLERMRNLLHAMAQREGVGEKSEQLMTRKSTSFGLTSGVMCHFWYAPL